MKDLWGVRIDCRIHEADPKIHRFDRLRKLPICTRSYAFFKRTGVSQRCLQRHQENHAPKELRKKKPERMFVYSNCKRELKMGTGSEHFTPFLAKKRVREVPVPFFNGACGKRGQAPSKRVLSPYFPHGATEPVPVFRLQRSYTRAAGANVYLSADFRLFGEFKT